VDLAPTFVQRRLHVGAEATDLRGRNGVISPRRDAGHLLAKAPAGNGSSHDHLCVDFDFELSFDGSEDC
jgi:hypothetical protein